MPYAPAEPLAKINKEQHTSKLAGYKDEIFTEVIDARLITTDSDGLKFASASALQLAPLLNDLRPFTSLSKYLITSPYNSPEHLQDLTRLSLEYRIFSLALSVMRPIRDDYATAEYLESFNWNEVLEYVRRLSAVAGVHWKSQEFYAVIFRSRLKPEADRNLLGELDSGSHAEAVESGGLLKYWFGTCSDERYNLATCKCFECKAKIRN
jgi:hypothetical protein